MKQMMILIAIACIGVIALSGVVYADASTEIDRTEQMERTIKDQNDMISELLRRIEALETTQEVQADWLEESKDDKPLWAEKVKVKGDLRYRHEYIDKKKDEAKEKNQDRHRHRIRARIGVDAELHPDLDVHLQIGTGSEAECPSCGGDPVSANQTLTNGWSGKNVWLLQAYFDYHPSMVEGLHIKGGKIKNPFLKPVKSELVWDGDVNPEGGVLAYKRKFDNDVTLMANGYGFWIKESSAEKSPEDKYVLGGQGALKYKFQGPNDSKMHVMGGLGYYDYENVEGESAICGEMEFTTITVGPQDIVTGETFAGDFFGNTSDSSGNFAEDYDLIEAFGEVGFKVSEIPVTIFGHYVVNDAAKNSEDTGWSVGFKVGKKKKPGSWDFRYLYKEIEEDAVMGVYTDSDFGGGGTNSEGHEINVGYQLTKKVSLGASLFLNDLGISSGDDETDYERFQFDVQYKF